MEIYFIPNFFTDCNMYCIIIIDKLKMLFCCFYSNLSNVIIIIIIIVIMTPVKI